MLFTKVLKGSEKGRDFFAESLIQEDLSPLVECWEGSQESVWDI